MRKRMNHLGKCERNGKNAALAVMKVGGANVEATNPGAAKCGFQGISEISKI